MLQETSIKMSESSISIQHQIRTQCETLTNSLKDMKKWELEMKQKEAEMQATKADQKQVSLLNIIKILFYIMSILEFNTIEK